MKTVKLSGVVENGSVKFSVSEPKEINGKYFSQSGTQRQLKELYKERYLLNSWKIYDKSDVMKKEFGR